MRPSGTVQFTALPGDAQKASSIRSSATTTRRFRAEASTRCEGEPLPRFIDDEFRGFGRDEVLGPFELEHSVRERHPDSGFTHAHLARSLGGDATPGAAGCTVFSWRRLLLRDCRYLLAFGQEIFEHHTPR